jgi:hypothetical protein
MEKAQSHAEIEREIKYRRENYDMAHKKVVQNGAQAMGGQEEGVRKNRTIISKEPLGENNEVLVEMSGGDKSMGPMEVVEECTSGAGNGGWKSMRTWKRKVQGENGEAV